MCAKHNDRDIMEWYKTLPPELLAEAYKEAEGEMAWPREAALRVIQFLDSQHYKVIGVDIWVGAEGGPILSGRFVYDWEFRPIPRGDLHPDTAYEFIKTFQWDPTEHEFFKNSEPVFNIWAERTG